jgi:hypothetical protein
MRDFQPSHSPVEKYSLPQVGPNEQVTTEIFKADFFLTHIP